LERPIIQQTQKFFFMKISSKLVSFGVAFVIVGFTARAGLFDQLKSTLTTTNGGTDISALSQDQIANGLKEALSKGVANAVASLGHDGGFLTNLDVKIPMPEKLQSVEKVLRLAGQNQMPDDFIGSMNHAAEQAVPVAAGVFGDAIRQMSIEDAKGILAGLDDAATQFFRKTTQTNLFALFHPIVQKATDAVGVTAKYKAMMGKFASVNSFGGLFGKSNAANLDAADIDTYVTNKALDGLFKMVAAEEKNIRANPVARTSDLLQKVFGSATK
jgi:uncharacterized protein DUF4197